MAMLPCSISFLYVYQRLCHMMGVLHECISWFEFFKRLHPPGWRGDNTGIHFLGKTCTCPYGKKAKSPWPGADWSKAPSNYWISPNAWNHGVYCRGGRFCTIKDCSTAVTSLCWTGVKIYQPTLMKTTHDVFLLSRPGNTGQFCSGYRPRLEVRRFKPY